MQLEKYKQFNFSPSVTVSGEVVIWRINEARGKLRILEIREGNYSGPCCIILSLPLQCKGLFYSVTLPGFLQNGVIGSIHKIFQLIWQGGSESSFWEKKNQLCMYKPYPELIFFKTGFWKLKEYLTKWMTELVINFEIMAKHSKFRILEYKVRWI